MPAENIVTFSYWLLPALAGAGLLAGTMAGLLGVGGGAITLPALYFVLRFVGVDDTVLMHTAVGTSLATIVPTSIRSVRAHARLGGFDRTIFRNWAPGMLIGVGCGAWLASQADFRSLVTLFGTVLLLIAIQMAFGRREVQLLHQPPRGLAAVPVAGTIGLLSTMIGVGGGAMSVPTLNLCGVPIHRAVGTAAGFGLLIALPGSLGMMLAGWNEAGLPPGNLGYVSLPGVLVIAPMAILTAPLGARLAHRLNPEHLRRVFALFLAVTALKMLSDAISG